MFTFHMKFTEVSFFKFLISNLDEDLVSWTGWLSDDPHFTERTLREDALVSKTLVRFVQYTHIGMRREGAASVDILDFLSSPPAC